MIADFNTATKGTIMGTVTVLLIFLCLFQGSQPLKVQAPKIERGPSQNVKIECIGEAGDSMDQGVYWYRQRKNARIPESIVFLSMVNKPLYRDQKLVNHFTAQKSGQSFTLTINTFQDEDQGTYYCMVIKNSVLTFSQGHELFYLEETTPKSPTTKPPAATLAPGSKSGDECNCGSDTKAEFWKIDCDTSIWASLAGVCGILLICLLATTIMLCCRTRRRRCRCKHRPMEEKNGQMNLMNKHKK